MKVSSNDRLRPFRADLGQLWIFLDLDPPTLVVRQVPVKVVELILRHQVDVLFNKLDRHKMPTDVEVHTAVTKTGTIHYFYCRKSDPLVDAVEMI